MIVATSRWPCFCRIDVSVGASGRGAAWGDVWDDVPHAADTSRHDVPPADCQDSAAGSRRGTTSTTTGGGAGESGAEGEEDGEEAGGTWRGGGDGSEGGDESAVGGSFNARGGHFRLESSKFVKLVPCGPGGLTTLEINGVKMHITMNKSPLDDARDKVRLARVHRGMTVLDVCTGLGYSAIAAARAGAKQVVTIELEDDVLAAAAQNEASAELFTHAAITQLRGNAAELLAGLPDGMFGAAMHDPPRLTHAGQLYSRAFYCELLRVMKHGARLFHYTGSPRGVSSKAIPRGIKERMMAAGFVDVRWQDSCQGFVATKP
ncbi:hypothetical protein FOA52_012583 [Chlamydomonas sp. UWO 241]|nr:hypothetical protein FOA52_012583 [Chlamydomonas sp. UWO 241]